MLRIYHNPRCSKSCEALLLVQQFANLHELDLEIIDYQKSPLTTEQLAALNLQLGCSVDEMVRDTEEEYALFNLSQADDLILLKALARHPKLLQRPIVSYRNRAVIGRPPDRISELLQEFMQD